MLVQFLTMICIPFPIYKADDKEHLPVYMQPLGKKVIP